MAERSAAPMPHRTLISGRNLFGNPWLSPTSEDGIDIGDGDLNDSFLVTVFKEAAMLGIPLGFAYANAMEWLLHRYVLHGARARRGGFYRFHLREHHRNARQNGFRDDSYARSIFVEGGQGKEAISLLGTAVLHLPLLPYAPYFTMTVWYCSLRYFRIHKRAHLDPKWAREHLPWHYDHHMGPNPNANWCVTRPWFDMLMGTRKPYCGVAQAVPGT